MKLASEGIYHIYNQGNNRRQIFYSEQDYLHFLRIFRHRVLPYSDVFAWCLMPNHFHFLLSANNDGLIEIQTGNIVSSNIGNGFRLLQTQYAQYLNKLQQASGSVFRQKAKVKEIPKGDNNYSYVCLHYIHQNPLRAGLINKIEDWTFSSYPDYAGKRKGSICNIDLACTLLDIDLQTFQKDSLRVMDEETLAKVRPRF
jgi:REP element-mobilizing transposase RayT